MSANAIDRSSVSVIVDHYDKKPEMLVQILQSIVQAHGWVSEDVIRQLAGELNLSRADIHGVVEFYHDFRTAPPGKHVIKVCQAEACQAMGSRELTAYAKQAVGDETTLEDVYCLGNCACAPSVMVDGRTYGRVDSARFDALLGALEARD
ncbi:MAG: NAD(P)H-dependent oxidoreductase subunit E [Woeseiaceae bacterium]|nr:NAD(P)H-dependent oxidoreductase subunit E [Woeseiaceae bacterium]